MKLKMAVLKELNRSYLSIKLEIFKKIIKNIQIQNLKESIMNWLESIKYDSKKMIYPFHRNSESNLFSLCFAIFIHDLIGVKSALDKDNKEKIIAFINEHQNPKNGYYYPKKGDYSLNKNSKTIMQLTTFCLSALHILGGNPSSNICFLGKWDSNDRLEKYLINKGCLSGIPGSGNYAMFVAIFIAHAYLKTKEKKYLSLLNKWFDLHDKSQNPIDGFWGNSNISNPYIRFQNSFHQIIVYEFFKRPLKNYEIIIDNIIKLSDLNGHYAPWPGGGGCYDYDAIHILISYGLKKKYRVNEIQNILNNSLKNFVDGQNKDGGFCETKHRPASIFQIFSPSNLFFYISSKSLKIFYQRIRHTYSISRKSHQLIKNHWSNDGVKWDESDLWNTWFKTLSIAEICNSLYDYDSIFNFQKFIGLGCSTTINDYD